MKKTGVILIFLLAALMARSQNLNGFWKGTLNMRGCFPENNIELQISMRDGVANGDSYHYLDIDNYVKKKFNGRFNREEKRLRLQEGLVTTHKLPLRCVICVKVFDLVYSVEGNIEKLSGQWGGNVLNSATDCGIGDIVLTRIKESAFKEVPEIKVDTGRIRLDFYDNAIIDNDTITVKINGRVVLSKERLTAKALTTYVRIDPYNPFHEVEMIAENLGSIPPNTAVLIITAGKNQHRLSLSSTDSKSAKVRILYEPPESSHPPARFYSSLD